MKIVNINMPHERHDYAYAGITIVITTIASISVATIINIIIVVVIRILLSMWSSAA